MTPVAVVVTAIGVLCAILLAVLKAVRAAAANSQRGNDLLENLQTMSHAQTTAINSNSRRTMALEIVIGQNFRDELAVAQKIVQDEDSAVHWIGPPKKDGTNE
jgi:hypothetical protein